MALSTATENSGREFCSKMNVHLIDISKRFNGLMGYRMLAVDHKDLNVRYFQIGYKIF